MAYSVNTTPTLEDIPSDVFNFATGVLGWNDLGDGIFAAPGADAGVGFKATYSSAGGTRYAYSILLHLVKDGVVKNTTPIYSPYVSGDYQLPSRLHLFGKGSGQPYLAVAIEYAPGFYRHGYVGYVEKIGQYGGGEVLTSAYYRKGSSGSNYDSWEHRYPFSGLAYGKTATQGCVRVVGDEVGGEAFLMFNAFDRRDGNTLYQNGIFGGFFDNVLEQKLYVGLSPFAGSHILVPINLYRALASNRAHPIGRPAGVRMIRMDNLDPAMPISVGNKTWRCFPVFKKSASTSDGAGSNFSDETSYIIGIAYQED